MLTISLHLAWLIDNGWYYLARQACYVSGRLRTGEPDDGIRRCLSLARARKNVCNAANVEELRVSHSITTLL